MPVITVRHEARDRFRISIRGHDLVVDQPAPASGDDGPTPTELFVASLAGCAAFYARRFLARHGLPDGELLISTEFSWAPDHSRIGSIALRVHVPRGVADGLAPALLRAIEQCTVHESIRQIPIVTCDIVEMPGRRPPDPDPIEAFSS
jgi:putative redox protein